MVGRDAAFPNMTLVCMCVFVIVPSCVCHFFHSGNGSTRAGVEIFVRLCFAKVLSLLVDTHVWLLPPLLADCINWSPLCPPVSSWNRREKVISRVAIHLQRMTAALISLVWKRGTGSGGDGDEGECKPTNRQTTNKTITFPHLHPAHKPVGQTKC